MSVSKHDTNPLLRIAQLEKDIATKTGELHHIKEQIIIALRRRGLSLRDIGAKPEVNLSHSQVAVIIKLHEAVNGPIPKAVQN